MNNSFVTLSGQRWKIWTLAGLLIAEAPLWLAVPLGMDRKVAPTLTLVGLALGLLTVAWAIQSLRCSRCRAKVLWLAMTTGSVGSWFSALATYNSCPACGFVPEPPPTTH
jgi:hypothetical protein